VRPIIIGERLNSSRAAVARALEARDEGLIREEARRQAESGAAYLDINAGAFPEQEPELLLWLAKTAGGAAEVPLCLDTASPRAAEACLKASPGIALLNALTGEETRLNSFIPLAREYGCGVIALCLDEAGLPAAAEGTVAIAGRVVERLAGAGFAPHDIYLDPGLRPVSIDPGAGVRALKAAAEIRRLFPEVHIAVGLSNISYGLPRRSLLNRTFAVMALAAGVDTFILDPCDPGLMTALTCARAALGRDRHCRDFLAAFRAGKLKG